MALRATDANFDALWCFGLIFMRPDALRASQSVGAGMPPHAPKSRRHTAEIRHAALSFRGFTHNIKNISFFYIDFFFNC